MKRQGLRDETGGGKNYFDLDLKLVPPQQQQQEEKRSPFLDLRSGKEKVFRWVSRSGIVARLV